jgi:nitroimidazol reductase NimA-like FMN-containing flavoprotein (pyridoxamine 5'-phosphate oxidase superfamily)
MKILSLNTKVSFSVVQNYSLIASFFSSTHGLACPATQFFKSVHIEGVASIVESREEKAIVFEALMKKLQPQGGYVSFNDISYDKSLKSTAVVKITPSNISAKFKFGQHLNQERFDMILSHLEQRDTKIDNETIEMMKTFRNTHAI